MKELLKIVEDMQAILGICPCCGDVFRLTEAKLSFPEKKLRPSEYENFVHKRSAIDKGEQVLERSELSLAKLEDKHRDKLRELREAATQEGRKRAKALLKKIDPHFTGRKIDPQDVKVLFDPVDFVVFRGLNSSEVRVSGIDIELISRTPVSKRQENICRSLETVVKEGNYDFEVLRVGLDGVIETK